MTLAQVQGVVAMVMFLIATWAGLIIAVALLLPKHTSMAERELTVSPLKSFFLGVAMLIPTIITTVMLRSPSGGLKLLGFVGLVCIGAALAIGASGMALLMGRRISEMTDMRTGFGGLVRGSVVYSLALGFPLIGWLAFLPICMILALGSGIRGICRALVAVHPPVNPTGPEYDVLERRGAV
jgi:hypothetical protein